ncbi:hypothetical protein AURDEDRAFT_30142, partial [Auricularia subglabra TFB-10046 SS5]
MLRKSSLRGFQIPGTAEKLIATLYADDTTVYLSEGDSYESLLAILEVWCKAAGARFNIQKTEIIPVGSIDHRVHLIENRKAEMSEAVIPEPIRIARDGEAVRILGAWPGNKVTVSNAWSTVLGKVQAKMDAWDKLKPSMNGKSLLSQVYGGGLTQYLTAAQGMPQKYEKELDKMILDFFWSGSQKHPLNMGTLRRTKDQG